MPPTDAPQFRDVELPERRSGPKPPPLRYEWVRHKTAYPYNAPYVYLARIDDQTLLQVIRAGNAYWSWMVIHLSAGQALAGGYGYAPSMGWAKARAEERLAAVRPNPQQQLWSDDAKQGSGEVPF